MRLNYGRALCHDGATLDDLREAVRTFEDIEPIARRVLGSAHPLVANIELGLREARDIARGALKPPAPSPRHKVT